MKRAFNSEIGILKFVFAIFIFLVHAYKWTAPLFGDGNFAVEFFFFLSGYYLAVHAVEKRDRTISVGESCRNYLAKRYLSLLPLLLIAILFGMVTRFALNGGLSKADLLGTVGDIFLTQAFRLGGAYYTGVAWFLSVLLIGIALLYPLLSKWPSYFINVFSIVFALFVYGYLGATTGNLSDPGSVTGIFMKGTLRGLAAMSIGCFLYGTVERMQNVKFLQNALVRNLIKWPAYLAVFAGMTFLNDSPYLFPLLAPYIIATALSLYEGTVRTSNGGAFGKVARFLQDISIPFYLLHWNVIAWAEKLAPKAGIDPNGGGKWLIVIAAFLCSLLLASLYLVIERSIQKQIGKKRAQKDPGKES